MNNIITPPHSAPAISEALQRKIDYAIRLIKSAVGDQTVEVSYSGGKDSDVILQLVREAGVKYRAIYKNTTIDPPGTLAHCRKNGVEIMPPKITFFHLLAKKGMPTRRCRFCCEKMKEYKVLDTSVQGIRRCESTARAANYSEDDPIICRMYGRKKKKKSEGEQCKTCKPRNTRKPKTDNHVNVILPILSWTDEDVAAFIADRHIQCHPLYYDREGTFHPERRLGCIGCPSRPTKASRTSATTPRCSEHGAAPSSNGGTPTPTSPAAPNILLLLA